MPILLQINAACNCGSTGRITEQIGLLAMNKGWNCYLIHGPRFVNPSKLITIQSVTSFQEKIHAIETRMFDNHGLSSRHSTRALIRKIEEINPDIIHLHNIHGYYINYKILFSFLKTFNKPIVWTFHDCWNFTGHCAHFVTVGCEKWQRECFDCNLKLSYPKSFIDNSKRNFYLKKKYFCGLNNLIIVPVSLWLLNLIDKSFLSKYCKYLIYNGVDVDIFKPVIINSFRNKYNIINKYLLVGVAASWNERKGFTDFIKLRELLSDEYLIVLVGLNRNIIKSLPKGILGIPRTENQTELAEIYSAADIVLNLSYAETFGLTTVEGFACGTPSIVYDCTASPELVTSDTGEVVPAGDINSLIDAINKILHNGKEYYSTFCRKRALEHFDKNKCFQKYIDLYTSLIADCY